MPDPAPSRVEIHIDEVVLDGLTVDDGRAVAESIGAQLARLVKLRGLTRGGHAERLVGADVELPAVWAGSEPAALVAASVLDQLTSRAAVPTAPAPSARQKQD